MINLTLKFSRTEVKEFSYTIMLLNKLSFRLEAEDYFHFFNIRSLYKRSNDRAYVLTTSKQKNISFRVNINEFESMKYVYFQFIEAFQEEKFIYYKAMLDRWIGNLDLQQKSVLRIDNFYGYSNRIGQ